MININDIYIYISEIKCLSFWEVINIITLIVFVDTFAWQKAINVVYGAMGSLSKWIDILYVF